MPRWQTLDPGVLLVLERLFCAVWAQGSWLGPNCWSVLSLLFLGATGSKWLSSAGFQMEVTSFPRAYVTLSGDLGLLRLGGPYWILVGRDQDACPPSAQDRSLQQRLLPPNVSMVLKLRNPSSASGASACVWGGVSYSVFGKGNLPMPPQWPLWGMPLCAPVLVSDDGNVKI